jgi:hypothetical protein
LQLPLACDSSCAALCRVMFWIPANHHMTLKK